MRGKDQEPLNRIPLPLQLPPSRSLAHDFERNFVFPKFIENFYKTSKTDIPLCIYVSRGLITLPRVSHPDDYILHLTRENRLF